MNDEAFKTFIARKLMHTFSKTSTVRRGNLREEGNIAQVTFFTQACACKIGLGIESWDHGVEQFNLVRQKDRA
ncbi:MAG: hypothetical protein HGA46_09340 [Chlorobiaceae bacterium]|nr:hypothetical protein [Chlorobiaceae bacterium]